MAATIAGVLIAESLRVGAGLDGINLTVTAISRADVGDERVGQPRTWTFIEFEALDEDAENLATALTEALDPGLGWYCDFRSPTETYVVFSGHVVRYQRGDPEGRAEAEAYGRAAGVPESQLDWPE